MSYLPWHLVIPGSVVVGKDQYEWTVNDVTKADDSAPRGTVKVVMTREGRGTVTGHPPAGDLIQVISSPPAPPEDPFSERATTRTAVTTLKETLGAVVAECGWCSGDPGSECICDVNCGAKGCVNF